MSVGFDELDMILIGIFYRIRRKKLISISSN